VVSTSLDEVRLNFGSVARVANNHDEFVALCRKEVESPTRARLDRGLKLAAENTWEAIVARMEHHIAGVLTNAASPQARRIVSQLPRLAYV
jgi:hypothetical protein